MSLRFNNTVENFVFNSNELCDNIQTACNGLNKCVAVTAEKDMLNNSDYAELNGRLQTICKWTADFIRSKDSFYVLSLIDNLDIQKTDCKESVSTPYGKPDSVIELAEFLSLQLIPKEMINIANRYDNARKYNLFNTMARIEALLDTMDYKDEIELLQEGKTNELIEKCTKIEKLQSLDIEKDDLE